MTILDGYAVVAYLRGEPSSGEVADLLREPTHLTAVNAAEVVDQMTRVFGRDPDSIEADLALLAHVGMEMPPVTPELAIQAGRLRARHYHRQHSAVSLADCIAAAAALGTSYPLATADPALATLVRSEGGHIHALPDSNGQRP
jgi:PIN domain nuclease of toxin-antitoxin system